MAFTLRLFFLSFIFNYNLLAQTMTADGHQSILVCSNGSIIGTGANGQGQLGSTTYIPNDGMQILLENDWEKVATGTNHTLFIKNDGTLWTSGDNSSGQLGLGDYVSRDVPEQIGTDSDWVFIDAGYYTSFAIKANGTLWSWGFSSEGALGLGGIGFSNVPAQVGVLDDWVQVSSLRNHTVGLRGDGTLWAWGQNDSGQLGDGTSISKFEPTNVAAFESWALISAGGGHSLALTNSGALWGCGSNLQGQLGQGDAVNYLVDYTVLDNSGSYLKIGAGSQHSIVLKEDGTLWSFGANGFGQLGNGDTVTVTSPIQVNTDTDWTDISVGHTHSIAKKSNGTLYAWGDNNSWALGVGSCVPNYCNVPQMVSLPCSYLSVINLGITNSFKISPNPVIDKVTISNECIEEFNLYELSGKKILSIQNVCNEIDVSKLNAGLYIIKMNSNNEIFTHKIVKR